MNTKALLQSYTLPCGVMIKNRIAKAAMTERLANKKQEVTKELIHLYDHWANNGAGLLITGNIMVDARYKEASANIVLEDEKGVSKLSEMIKAGTKNDTQLWAQINHAGRQASIFSTFKPIAPSAIQLKKLMLFAKPKAMNVEQIKDVENRFVNTAILSKKAGFTGVQIHAAHGYLLSQFLSPKTNQRTDNHGGSIQNRARLLFDIVKRVREELGENYPISVKLNSADFQRGGFNEEDALYVIKKLESLQIDLLEISGGTYENIIFLTQRYQRESTKQREAYFLDFAKKIRKETALPMMVTGGFRSHAFCNQVLENKELEMIGFARPFLVDKDFPKQFLKDEQAKVDDATFNFKIKKMKDFAEAGFYDYQIHQLAKGKELKPDYNPYLAVLRLTTNELRKGWF
ncbi:NADH:flavin oxidoreductase/NADH oxidase family protein [Tenacibaculum sp. M341]|uniref:NADH:flavin oxidoreductase/NADH oxidase family protein n=1 Tax=Tenacibaculum sp. M341 TaxID=2530339 RepID=UPI0010534D1C|nr:NADH:flavin oxidoreductase/NADH oxidase family protein [Tenacibaculum sp. M341]TCI90130.1 NADH:flavin oxidoreductase/NADH oxidase family protein [Tenacibaculum sp. M341]